MDDYVLVQYPAGSTDPDYGAEIITWTDYGYAWADISDISTRNQERITEVMRSLQQPCKVVMRYDANIKAHYRIVVKTQNDRVIEFISAPVELGRREAMEFIGETYSV